MRRWVAFIAGLAVTLGVSASALAQDAPSAATARGGAFAISLEPGPDPATTEKGYFVYEIAAGTEATGGVRLGNTGQEPVTIALAAVDAETAQTGGSAYASAAASPTAAGAWIRLGAPRVTLAPGEEMAVSFTVEPPAGTAPGQYLAGLAAYAPTPSEAAPVALEANQAGASVVVQTRYVIGVQVDVPGEWTPAMKITGASALEQPSGTKLGIAMRNTGDTFLKPEGSVTLRDAAQTPILEQPIALETLVTGAAITYPIAWPGVPRAGKYTVDVELRYAADEIARYSGTLAIGEDEPAAEPASGEPEPPATAPRAAPQAAPQPAPSSRATGFLLAIAGLLAAGGLLAVLMVRGRRRW